MAPVLLGILIYPSWYNFLSKLMISIHFPITHTFWKADYVASSPIKNLENTEKIDELCKKIEVMNTEDTVVIIIKAGF